MSDDFCEYVYNPLMRQYQAMIRLMEIMRNSQAANCNDIQCFTDETTNPLNNLTNNSDPSFLMTYGPMLFIWAIFAFALFMFRPNSMRKPIKEPKKNSHDSVSNSLRNNNNDDDDDNSTVS